MQQFDRTVVVTGAARGIGRAVAEHFLAAGARVVALDRDADGLAAFESTHPGSSLFTQTIDVGHAPSWTGVPLRDDRVDLLVAAAGIALGGPTARFDVEQWRRVFSVNLDGAFLACQTYHDALRRSTDPSVVVVGSAAGLRPGPHAAAYSASKAALLSLVRSLAQEWAQEQPRIRVNAVSPGSVRTPMWAEQDWFRAMIAEHGGEDAAFAALAQSTPLHRIAEAEEIVSAIAWLAGDGARHVTGANLLMDGGWSGA